VSFSLVCEKTFNQETQVWWQVPNFHQDPLCIDKPFSLYYPSIWDQVFLTLQTQGLLQAILFNKLHVTMNICSCLLNLDLLHSQAIFVYILHVSSHMQHAMEFDFDDSLNLWVECSLYKIIWDIRQELLINLNVTKLTVMR